MIKEGLAQLAAAHSRDKTAFVKNSMSENTLTGGRGGMLRHPPPLPELATIGENTQNRLADG